MKRNKIKPKYLPRTLPNIEETKRNNDNLFDKIEKTIFNLLSCMGLILLFLVWGFFPIIILEIGGIHYQEISSTQKVIASIFSDIVFLGILFIIYHKNLILDFKNYFNRNWKEHLKESFRYWIIGLSIMIISNLVIEIVTGGKLATNEQTVREMIQLAPWYMTFELMIFAPFSEELIFRKSIRKIIQNRYIYAIISGLIFGGLHVVSSLETTMDLLYFIPYCSLGFIFALLYSKTNNIFSTITIHSLHNTLALILYLTTLS